MYLCFDISINIYTCICTHSNIHNMTVPIELSSKKMRTCYGGSPLRPRRRCSVEIANATCDDESRSTPARAQGGECDIYTYIMWMYICIRISMSTDTCHMHAWFFFPPLSLFLFMLCHRFSRTMTWVGPKRWIQ